MPKAKNITVIPATLNLHTGVPKNVNVKRRVAGYARVSTDSDEQVTSYAAQVDYYTNYIKSKPDWDFVDVYTDEGISGVMTKHRDGFNRMISDALAGKIDLIVTKSVSRFARNTVDSLTTVRKLKEKGVEVYFEKENIYTLDSKGELLITIMSSLAQEESRSISENVTWGQRKRFADGKVSMPYKQFLGYRKGADGLPEIVPEEAELVIRVYKMFMSGKSTSAIARQLTNEGIPTPGRKKVWQKATVDSILTNEKYKGAALLQKKYTVDFLTKTMKVNEGEVPQYYVEDSHPAIIKPEEWEAVQVEMEQRRSKGRRHDCSSPFSGKIFCGDCGGVYGSKTWHSTDKYRRVIWQCNHKYDNGEKCGTPHLREEDLKDLFVQALGQYMDDPDERMEGLQYVQRTMTDTTFIDADLEETEQKLDLLSGMIRNCIMLNASATVTEREYRQQYEELTRQYEDMKAKYEALQERRKQMNETAIIFGGMLFELWELEDVPVTFKESLWHTLVDHATVYADERIVFHFKDGTEVTTML